MTTYASLVRKEGQIKWSWGGLVNGATPKNAASHLAVAVEGYDFRDEAAVIEAFVDDGWRFKLIEVKTEDGEVIEYENSEIG